MVRQLGKPRHEALRQLLVDERDRVGISQQELGRRLGWSQRTISKIECGEKRVTAVELMEIAEVLGFDAIEAFRKVNAIK